MLKIGYDTIHVRMQFVYLRAFYEHFTIFNFLTELDTDIFMENKIDRHCRVSPNILKNLYRVRAYVHARAQLFNGAR